MPDHVADSTCATGLVEVGALGGVDLLRELADVFLLLPFERAPEPVSYTHLTLPTNREV